MKYKALIEFRSPVFGHVKKGDVIESETELKTWLNAGMVEPYKKPAKKAENQKDEL